MCQLTFANLNDPVLHKIYLTTQLLINTEKSHRDGFGFYTDGSPNGIFKSANTPPLVTNLADLIAYYMVKTNPVMAHVRLATVTNGVKCVDKTKSHPFTSKDFVLCHNGTLETADPKVMTSPEYKDLIDSAIFLEELQKVHSKGKKSVYDSLVETMAAFHGKFAFLIYSKKEHSYYMARGTMAKLHFASVLKSKQNNATGGEKIGFVVNTDKDDLGRAVTLSTQLFSLAYPGDFFYVDKIEELKEKSVFKVNGIELERIGDIEETPLVRPVVTNFGRGVQPQDFTRNTSRLTQGWTSSISGATSESEKKLIEIMDKLELDLKELDTIFYAVFNASICACEPQEIEYLLEYVVPMLDKKKTRQKHILWKKITGTWSPMYAYHKALLQFPWMLNDIKVINPTWAKLKYAIGQNDLSKFTPVVKEEDMPDDVVIGSIVTEEVDPDDDDDLVLDDPTLWREF